VHVRAVRPSGRIAPEDLTSIGNVTTRDQVSAAVREIICVDLKFSGMEVTDDLKLVGGGLELDSLDLLLMVTSIEKRFGHKITQRKLGRETMSTAGSFIDFVHQELSSKE